MAMASASILFGESNLNARIKYRRTTDKDQSTDGLSQRPRKGSFTDWVFGFMYEEQMDETEDDILYRSTTESSTHIWNPLNVALFVTLALSTAATAVPVTLLSALNEHSIHGMGNETTAYLAQRAMVAGVMGSSIGKIVNGPIAELAGARKTCATFSSLLALSLVVLALAQSIEGVMLGCFLVEFCYSVQWPCCIVILATHYRGNSSGMYEGGIFVTSLAARLGSLIGIPLCAMFLRKAHWRLVALLGAWTALIATSVAYLYLADSPDEKDQPQNPVDTAQLQKWFPALHRRRLGKTQLYIRLLPFIMRTNVLPSVRHVLGSGTFWIVAMAHTGASVVRTSERILGAYFYETSFQSLSENRASSMAVFLSLGILVGLIFAGTAFASRQEQGRKLLVSRLYILAIAACYVLALLAVPSLRSVVNSPSLISIFQAMAVATAGFGIAVQFYHIPSLVGASFGCDKGLFSAYCDGVAYLFASLIWRSIGSNVEGGQADGSSWIFSWSAVALLLILSGTLMVEFMEHYFCRTRSNGSYEAVIFG